MRRQLLPRATALLTALAGLLALSGCGLGTAGGDAPTGTLAGPLADVESLEGAEISVGSKNFTEQLLLGKIAVILLQSAGADVEDLTNIPGSASARAAQLEGQVDMEWEYTGTAWEEDRELGQANSVRTSTTTSGTTSIAAAGGR